MRSRRGRERGGHGLGSFLISPLGIVFTTVVIDLIGFGIVIPILPIYAKDLGASPTMIGGLAASYALMQFLFAPVWGRLSDRYGRRPVILVALAGTVVSSLLIGFATALWFLWLARILNGIAGASYAAAQAYVADVTGPDDRARGMGLIGAAFGLGFVLGPAIGGLCALIRPARPVLRRRRPRPRQPRCWPGGACPRPTACRARPRRAGSSCAWPWGIHRSPR